MRSINPVLFITQQQEFLTETLGASQLGPRLDGRTAAMHTAFASSRKRAHGSDVDALSGGRNLPRETCQTTRHRTKEKIVGGSKFTARLRRWIKADSLHCPRRIYWSPTGGRCRLLLITKFCSPCKTPIARTVLLQSFTADDGTSFY